MLVSVWQYKSVLVPLIVIVPILVPEVRLRVNDTVSALVEIPSNFDLSEALINPGADEVAGEYVVLVSVGAYSFVVTPLIVIVPICVPEVSDCENATLSALAVMPSSFDLSLADKRPAFEVVAASYVVLVSESVTVVTEPSEPVRVIVLPLLVKK